MHVTHAELNSNALSQLLGKYIDCNDNKSDNRGKYNTKYPVIMSIPWHLVIKAYIFTCFSSLGAISFRQQTSQL